MVRGKKRGWTSRATAVTESTGKVIDIVFKNTECKQCNEWTKKKSADAVTNLEYLELFRA